MYMIVGGGYDVCNDYVMCINRVESEESFIL